MTKATLEALYKVKNGGSISANECIEINKALASTNPEDIPNSQIENVKDYLIHALNFESVDINYYQLLTHLPLAIVARLRV